jgi:hypothetical protein
MTNQHSGMRGKSQELSWLAATPPLKNEAGRRR